MKSFILLIHLIFTATSNVEGGFNLKCIKNRSDNDYNSIISSYKIMDVRKLRESNSEAKKIVKSLKSFEANFDGVIKKLMSVESVCFCLKKALNSEKLSSLNKFEKTKIEMDIENLFRCLENDSGDNIKIFKDFLTYKRNLTRYISRTFNICRTINANLNRLLKHDTISSTMSPDEIKKLKSDFQLSSLLRLVLNYNEILAIKNSFETYDNLDPAKVYLKSLIKTLNCDRFKSISAVRDVFRDDGTIPNRVMGFPSTKREKYNELAIIVFDALQNIEIDEIDGFVAKQIINTIHKRFHGLLREYNRWANKTLLMIRKIGGCEEKKKVVARNIERSLKRYFLYGMINGCMKYNKTKIGYNLEQLDDQEF